MSAITWKQKLESFSAHHVIQFDTMAKMTNFNGLSYKTIVLFAVEIYHGNLGWKRTQDQNQNWTL